MNEKTPAPIFLAPRINEFNTFLQEIRKHLTALKKEPICLETSKYHYNLPSDVKIYNLDEALKKYKEFYESKTTTISPNIKWSLEEINLFIFILLYYMELHDKTYDALDSLEWAFIAKFMMRQSSECQIKWSSLMKSRSNKKSWTTEEDNLLSKIIKFLKNVNITSFKVSFRTHLKKSKNISWVNISQELFEKSDRTIIKMARRCRERWINYLNPTLKKGSWTNEEDLLLLKGYQEHNKKWSVISETLKGRNLNSVKNRFHSILKKNNVLSPTAENIEKIMQKLKTSEKSIDNSKENILDEEEKDEEELKIEENKNPKKQVKHEFSEKQWMDMYKEMQSHYQSFYDYSHYFNMANTFFNAAAPGGFPNFFNNFSQNSESSNLKTPKDFNNFMSFFMNKSPIKQENNEDKIKAEEKNTN